ncbi:Matrixin [Popillia japonica]|uniref:Matrixin n=1 Tax=Popillia japonica TaxID=7064 RepID=A0AAW1MER4_POPJA
MYLRTKNATNVNLVEAEWVFSKALDVWAQNSRLTFNRVDNDRADILVYFHRGEHGDLFPFDGKGQILAHAFFPGPGKGGDAHFDMDEIWITNDRDDDGEGTDLFKVAAHEFGHSLGLAHSNEEGALMSPWYQGSSKSTDYQLPEDDRKAIQALYGRKPDYKHYTTTTTTTTTTRPPHAYNPYQPYNNNPRYPYYPNYHPQNPPYHPRHTTTEKPRKPMHPGKKYSYPYPKDPDKYPGRHTTKPPTKYYPSDRYPNWYPTRRMHYPPTTTTTTTTTRRPPLRHYPDHHPKPDACNTSFDAVAVIRREVFFFKDAVGLQIIKNPPYHPRHTTTEKPRKPMHPGKKYSYPYPKDPDKYPGRHTTKPPTKYYPSDRYPNWYPTRRMHYPPTTTTTTTTTRRPPLRHYPDHHPKPDACNTSFDAVAVIRREVFFFKDAYFWRIGDTGLLPGHPALITRMWPALPRSLNHVDAVYETPDNKIVFFIDKEYYVFSGNSLEHGYPRPLTNLGLPARLSKIDGATVWGHNGKTFFFSGHEYWRFDEDSKRVELDYPRNMDMWKGVAKNIDAVFQWRDGKTYFFKDTGFWKFDDNQMKVGSFGSSGSFWFGCTHNFEDRHSRKQPFTATERTSATNRLKTDYSLLFFAALAALYQYIRSARHTPS